MHPLQFLLLLGELSGVSGCGDRVSSLLPLYAETLQHRHYPQHINLLETLLKLVRWVIKGYSLCHSVCPQRRSDMRECTNHYKFSALMSLWDNVRAKKYTSTCNYSCTHVRRPLQVVTQCSLSYKVTLVMHVVR